MMQQFLKWLGNRFFARDTVPEVPSRAPGVRVRPPAARPRATAPKTTRVKTKVNGEIVDGGPGKNILIRNKRFVREDTGTHDTLKILDSSLTEADEETGIDPYNTGRFDRSKSWEFRSRK